ETASGRVDKDRVTTHHRQLFRADHVASLLREWNMKGDDVAFLKNGKKIDEPGVRNDIGRQHPHPEGFRAASDRLAKFTKPDNAKRRASDIADRMREETELASVLPPHRCARPHDKRSGFVAMQRSTRRHVQEPC